MDTHGAPEAGRGQTLLRQVENVMNLGAMVLDLGWGHSSTHRQRDTSPGCQDHHPALLSTAFPCTQS